MREIFAYYPELRLCNIANISDRLLKQSDGDMFVAYNVKKDQYEVHSVRSFKLNRHSINGVIEPEEMHGGFLELIKANDTDKFGDVIRDERLRAEHVHNKQEEKYAEWRNQLGRKLIKTTLGREV